MRLCHIGVGGYRAFMLPAEMELRPLTLVFGHNNAGKSALLRLFDLMRAAIMSGSLQPLAASLYDDRPSSFLEMYTAGQPERVMTFKLEWVDSWDVGPANPLRLSANFTVRYLDSVRLSIVESAILEDSEGLAVALRWIVGPPTIGESGIEGEYETKVNGTAVDSTTIAFAGFLPKMLRGIDRVGDLLHSLAAGLRAFATQVTWLGPLRTVPMRIEPVADNPQRLMWNGVNAQQFLASDAVGDGNLVGFVSDWFETATMQTVEVVRGVHSGRAIFSVELSPVVAPTVRIPIADGGDGISQVLPVVVLLGLAAEGRLGAAPILSFEHPELHLHSRAHSHLADLFCQTTHARCAPTMLVETHSENFLLGVQLAIAKKIISSDDVIVHWVRQTADGNSVVESVSFDGYGTPAGPGWPPEAFGEASSQALELLALRRGGGERG